MRRRIGGYNCIKRIGGKISVVIFKMKTLVLRASLLLRIFLDARQLDVVTNFNDGSLVYGEESTMTDYVTLANDPKANLPESFTVCSSLFIKFMLTKNNFIEILKEDGTHWFQMDLEHLRDFSTLTERITLIYHNPISGKEEVMKFWDNVVPISPHAWYHICLGLDTVSGLLRIVINGFEIVNEEKDFFKNTSSIKPTSVAGKFLGEFI